MIDPGGGETIAFGPGAQDERCEQQVGLDIGFSIQPLIERRPDGSLHPAIYGAAELAKAIERRFS